MLANQDVVLTHGFAQARRRLAKKIVSGRMSEGVIDIFEMIEIAEQQSNTGRRILRGLPQGIGQPVLQEGSVWQAGQRVVMCEMNNLCLGDTPL